MSSNFVRSFYFQSNIVYYLQKNGGVVLKYDEIIIFERISNIERTIKKEEHDISTLTNSIARYKERLEWLERMKTVYQKYNPTSWEEWACKLYVECADLNTVARQLNEMGYRLPGATKSKLERKITTNDVSDLFKMEPKNELQECAKAFFEVKNKAYWGEKY